MTHLGKIMLIKLNSWKPAAVGFITLFIDNLTEINIIVQILVGIGTFAYIVVRTYYFIKNKGKDKK